MMYNLCCTTVFSFQTKSGNNFYLLMLLSICVVSLALVQFNRYLECALLLILDLTQVGVLRTVL